MIEGCWLIEKEIRYFMECYYYQFNFEDIKYSNACKIMFLSKPQNNILENPNDFQSIQVALKMVEKKHTNLGKRI